MNTQSTRNEKVTLEILNKLDSVYLTLSYDPQEGWVFYRWRGFIRLPEIKEGFNKIIDFLQDQNASMILGDHSGIVGPWNEGNEWLIQEWAPRASALGLQFWAIHTGDDLFSNISLELFLTREHDADYLVKICEHLDEANSWLKEVSKSVKAKPTPVAELPEKDAPPLASSKDESPEKNL